MQVGVMVTNGGPHSAEKWAEVTASYIVTIAENIAGEKRGSAVKLQAAVIDILEGHHTTVQAGERCACDDHGVGRLQHDMTCDDHVCVDEVIEEIIAASVGTPWEGDFKYKGQCAIETELYADGSIAIAGQPYKPSSREALRATLTDHFMQSAFIERSWHADRNLHTPEAQAFHKQFKGE